jgi:membrane fusion protein, heavy metal efflux system
MSARLRKLVPWIIAILSSVGFIATSAWIVREQWKHSNKLATPMETALNQSAIRQSAVVQNAIEARSLVVPLSKQKAAGIELCKVKQEPWQIEHEISGRIELDPDRHFAVTTPTEVFVQDVYVALGGEVRHGQPLLKLSCPEIADIRSRLATSRQSEVRAREALDWHRNLEENVTLLVDAINSKDAARLQQDWSSKELGKLGGQILEALANQRTAEKILIAMKPASVSGALPEKLLIENEMRLAAAETLLQTTIQQTRFDLRQQVLQAANELKANERTTESIQSELNHLIGSASTSEEQNAGADELDSFIYRSNRDGILIERNFARGERAAAGAIQVLVADVSKIWVAGDLRPQDWDLLSIEKGTPVDVRVLGLEQLGTLTGKQVYVGGKVQSASGAIRIAVEVENKEGLLRPGMFAQLRFYQPLKELSHILPSDALFTNDGNHFILVKSGEESFELLPVKIGHSSDRQVELLTDIPANSQIVSKGVLAIASDAILEEE